MRLFASNYRLLGWITLILVAGFVTTSGAAFLASRDAIELSISDQALPLTGDNVYSELQKDILYPVFISSLMAHDVFVREWLVNGEQNPEQIKRYLNGITGKYGIIGSFLASEASRKRYNANGPASALSESEAKDAWFFRVKAMREGDYETNIDIDQANGNHLTLFINYRVLDEQDKFLGVAGVGITLDAMNKVLARYQERFGRLIYFVDGSGKIMLTGKPMPGKAALLSARPGMREIAPAILKGKGSPSSLSYHNGKAEVLVNARFIPELGWYLIVEQNVSGTIGPLNRIFAVTFAISFGITLLVLIVTLLTVNRFQQHLQKLASTDALTGLLNRQALAVLFRQAILGSRRSGRPLSAILFDIDHFKKVNDAFGHVVGDSVIRQVALITQDVVRASDVVTRWGGEEYFILLGDCQLHQAGAIAENLRQRVAEHDFKLPSENFKVTISLGLAQYHDDEGESAFFTRADTALYEAKNGGRNRSHVSPAPPAHMAARLG